MHSPSEVADSTVQLYGLDAGGDCGCAVAAGAADGHTVSGCGLLHPESHAGGCQHLLSSCTILERISSCENAYRWGFASAFYILFRNDQVWRNSTSANSAEDFPSSCGVAASVSLLSFTKALLQCRRAHDSPTSGALTTQFNGSVMQFRMPGLCAISVHARRLLLDLSAHVLCRHTNLTLFKCAPQLLMQCSESLKMFRQTVLMPASHACLLHLQSHAGWL